MKKVFLGLLLGLFVMFTFNSCEKEEVEQPMQLSEFIVGGNWVYTQIEYNLTHVLELTFTGSFWEDGTYDLLLSDGTNSMGFDGNYTIDNELNRITIDSPDIENTGATEQAVFDIDWVEGVEQMTWTDTDPENEEDPMVWVRNYNE